MIFDAHTHLFSRQFFAGFYKQKHGTFASETQLKEMIEPFGLELPPAEPEEHAARWVREMDKHGIDRMVMFTSLPGEQTAVAAAVKAFPQRLTGYTMVDPKAPGALETLTRDLTELNLKGIELFPAMHRFAPSDESLTYPIYELAAKHGVPVFVHVGILRVKLRELLGLPSRFDLSLSNPVLLHRAAADHPKVRFIIPHLGCGFLREAAFLGHQVPNVYIDTSSSNTWLDLLPEPVTLARALELCLHAFGEDRVLFGTDSSTLPRGYRGDILKDLKSAMTKLKLKKPVQEKILGGNLGTLLNT
jgi:uncharacterized protein